MKTNVTMISEKDRSLYGVVIRQETKTCMLNLSDLQEAYTVARIKNGWSDKQLQDILHSKSNAERIYFLLQKQEMINTEISVFMQDIETQGIIKVLKNCGAYKTTGRGKNKTVFCNPYVWVLVALELNPELYAEVVMWLTDKLILNRIEAGNFYRSLSKSLAKIKNPDYKTIAMTLNIKVFGKHETAIRNTGSKDQLEQLARIEDNISYEIDKGYISTNDQIVKAIKDYKR